MLPLLLLLLAAIALIAIATIASITVAISAPKATLSDTESSPMCSVDEARAGRRKRLKVSLSEDSAPEDLGKQVPEFCEGLQALGDNVVGGQSGPPPARHRLSLRLRRKKPRNCCGAKK